MSPARQVSTGQHSADTECQAVHALVDCVAPLVRDVRERGLVSSCFFVNDWPAGLIQLRLKPAGVDHLDEVCRTADAAMSRFLARHEPSTDEPDDCLRVDHLELLYADEERRWISGDPATRLPGGGGRVRFRRYQPDYDRYGGPAGVDLAEWHFEYSSDQVLDLAQSVDAHTRSTMLGLSAQLTMIMTAAFLPDTRQLAAYLAGRGADGATAGAATGAEGDAQPAPDPDWEPAVPVLRRRFAEIRAAVAAIDPDDAGDQHGSGSGRRRAGTTELADWGGDWAGHCHELRERALELHRAGALAFPQPVGRETDLLARLLTPYLQATNNRLGASPADEAYVVHLLARAVGVRTRRS